MQQVTEIVSRAAPLDRSDVDTDQIIPSDWLKRVERTGFGEGLFSEWRERSDFVLNQERYDGAEILVAGPNFGTGSSREHAVWALQDYGFRAVISSRFADIFRNNSLKTGLVPVQIPQDVVERIIRAVEDDPSVEVIVDVVDRRVAVPAIDLDEPFELDDFTHHRLLNGLDDIGISLQHEPEITRFEESRPAWAPRSRRRRLRRPPEQEPELATATRRARRPSLSRSRAARAAPAAPRPRRARCAAGRSSPTPPGSRRGPRPLRGRVEVEQVVLPGELPAHPERQRVAGRERLADDRHVGAGHVVEPGPPVGRREQVREAVHAAWSTSGSTTSTAGSSSPTGARAYLRRPSVTCTQLP